MKKISILGILAILVIVAEFTYAMIAGWVDMKNSFLEGYNSVNVHSGTPQPEYSGLFDKVYVDVRPLETTAVDSLTNRFADKSVPYQVKRIGTVIVPTVWSSIVNFFAMFAIIPFFVGIYCLIRLLVSISKREVFTSDNVARLRFFTYSFAALYGLMTLHDWLNHLEAVKQVALLGYEVVATGANPRELGLAKEKELIGHGVAYCASCDGMFYKDKIVVVVGGGNSAVSDAVLLSRIAKKVIIVHRRDTLRATKIYHDQLMKTENIEFRWNNTVNELIYGERLTGVRLKDTVTGEENIIECDGLFVSIGRKPTTDFLDNQIELDNKGYIVAGENTETSIPGVYAVGDVRTKLLRQIVTAVADGAMAVHMAEEYVEK